MKLDPLVKPRSVAIVGATVVALTVSITAPLVALPFVLLTTTR